MLPTFPWKYRKDILYVSNTEIRYWFYDNVSDRNLFTDIAELMIAHLVLPDIWQRKEKCNIIWKN